MKDKLQFSVMLNSILILRIRNVGMDDQQIQHMLLTIECITKNPKLGRLGTNMKSKCSDHKSDVALCSILT